MRSPLNYYGGKNSIADQIVDVVHRSNVGLYVEPFAGGASVLLKKRPHVSEVLNDWNLAIYTFWLVLQQRPQELKVLAKESSLHHEHLFKKARQVWKDPNGHNELVIAWAVFYLSIFSVNGTFSGFSISKQRGSRTALFEQRITSLESVAERIKNCQIINRDALSLIPRFDSPNTVFYFDPPYVGADQGHYKGYTQKKFSKLLQLLKSLKGKFVLSHYQNKEVEQATQEMGWHTSNFERHFTIGRSPHTSIKTEHVTHNLPDMIQQKQLLEA